MSYHSEPCIFDFVASRQPLQNSGQRCEKIHVDVQKGEGALSLYQLKEKENRGVEDRIFVSSCLSKSVSKISEQGETETCEEAAILKYLNGKQAAICYNILAGSEVCV